MKKIVGELLKNKHVDENLKAYCGPFMEINNKYANIRLAMNYYTYYTMTLEDESLLSTENMSGLATINLIIEELMNGESEKISENIEKITNPGNKTIYRIYDKETGMLRADLICFADETFNTGEDLLLFDPNATWKKTLLPGGTYTMRELLVPIFQHGECKYESPSVKEIAEFCRQEKKTLWDETKRLFNPHKVYVDLSQKLYDTKTKLLNEAHH